MGEFYYIFIGCFVGICTVSLTLGLKNEFDNIWIFSAIGHVILIIYIFSIEAGWFSLGIIGGGFFAIKQYLNEGKKQKENIKPKPTKYINHCWNCKTPVNSYYDKLCPKCRKHYICSNCGKCWCDAPDEIKYRNRN